jgi:hypothetical protein
MIRGMAPLLYLDVEDTLRALFEGVDELCIPADDGVIAVGAPPALVL